jgi:hypothetical protein
MKRSLPLAVIAAAAFVLAASPAGSATRETAPVIDVGAMAPVDGAWATLVRNGTGLSATFHTHGLPAREAFTLWMVAFNHPEACTHPIGTLSLCGEEDLFDEATAAAVFRAGGHVVGSGGPATIAGSLKVGQTKDALTVPDDGGFVTPFGLLTNPMGAEVHLVLLRHGPWVPGAPALFHTFWYCNPSCADWQVAFFPPAP